MDVRLISGTSRRQSADIKQLRKAAVRTVFEQRLARIPTYMSVGARAGIDTELSEYIRLCPSRDWHGTSRIQPSVSEPILAKSLKNAREGIPFELASQILVLYTK